MMFIVATNVDASRPPDRQTSGTPLARAKNLIFNFVKSCSYECCLLEAGFILSISILTHWSTVLNNDCLSDQLTEQLKQD